MQLMFSLFGLNMIKALKIAGNALAIARAVSDYFAGLNHVNPSKLNINTLFIGACLHEHSEIWRLSNLSNLEFSRKKS